MSTEHDIIVSGGGIAGLIAALAFGARGSSVLCVDPATPVTDAKADGADMRSTAFLQPARAVLDEIGLWPRLEPHAAALQVMRILDAGRPEAEPVTAEFDASDISHAPFGWNFPNWLLRREALAAIANHGNITLAFGTGVTTVLPRSEEAKVTLTDGRQISAQLLIGADGRNSPTRKALGIGVKTYRYGQKALAFSVSHPLPHNNVSTEVHRTGGPFTLVPLPDRDGMPASAIVWMDRASETERRAALAPEAFTEELNDRSENILGPLKLITPRATWPIISQHAEALTAPHVALIAEAAHVVPPIGAQGLNMSLSDLSALLEHSPKGLGSPSMLAAYERARMSDIRTRLHGIDLLNRASMAQAQPLRNLRALGLTALHSISPVRKTLMRLGLGANQG